MSRGGVVDRANAGFEEEGSDQGLPTPRTDAFVEALPPMVMMADEMAMAHQVRKLMVAWASFARSLERECAGKVWPQ